MLLKSLHLLFLFGSAVNLGPYDFRDVENADKIMESSHKNGFYFITWNVMEIWRNLDE